MKNIFVLLTLAVMTSRLNAQQIVNWRSLDSDHIIQANAGLESSSLIGLGYARRIPSKKNILVSADYSFPLGNQLFDDFKIRLGGQYELVQWNNWSVTTRVYAIYRRYQNSLTTMANFGTELSVMAGYARPKWQVMGEFGFDKAIATKIRNSDLMKANYPGVQDGWYVPTGGTYFYGALVTYSWGRQDVFLRGGKMMGQDWETAPYMPFYLRVGFNYRFGGKK